MGGVEGWGRFGRKSQDSCRLGPEWKHSPLPTIKILRGQRTNHGWPQKSTTYRPSHVGVSTNTVYRVNRPAGLCLVTWVKPCGIRTETDIIICGFTEHMSILSRRRYTYRCLRTTCSSNSALHLPQQTKTLRHRQRNNTDKMHNVHGPSKGVPHRLLTGRFFYGNHPDCSSHDQSDRSGMLWARPTQIWAQPGWVHLTEIKA